MEVSFLSAVFSFHPRTVFLLSNSVHFEETVILQRDSCSMGIFLFFCNEKIMYPMAKHCLCVSPFGNLHTFSKHFHQRVEFGILEFFFPIEKARRNV